MIKKDKDALRKQFRDIRGKLSEARREEAKQKVEQLLESRFHEKKTILSYSPLSEEVNLSSVNIKLAARGMLALPRMENHHIRAYSVKNIETDLIEGKYGFLEPIAEKSSPVKNIDIALVPGLIFDMQGNRIGFGFGHYDHLLNRNTSVHTIGIAFKEQVHSDKLILGSHDVPMDEMCIV